MADTREAQAIIRLVRSADRLMDTAQHDIERAKTFLSDDDEVQILRELLELAGKLDKIGDLFK